MLYGSGSRLEMPIEYLNQAHNALSLAKALFRPAIEATSRRYLDPKNITMEG